MPEENPILKEVQGAAKAIAEEPKNMQGMSERLFHDMYKGVVSEDDNGNPTIKEDADLEGLSNTMSKYLVGHLVDGLDWKEEDKAFLDKPFNKSGEKVLDKILEDNGLPSQGALIQKMAQIAAGGVPGVIQKAPEEFAEVIGQYAGTQRKHVQTPINSKIMTDTKYLDAAKKVIKEAFGDATPEELKTAGPGLVTQLLGTAATKLYNGN